MPCFICSYLLFEIFMYPLIKSFHIPFCRVLSKWIIDVDNFAYVFFTLTIANSNWSQSEVNARLPWNRRMNEFIRIIIFYSLVNITCYQQDASNQIYINFLGYVNCNFLCQTEWQSDFDNKFSLQYCLYGQWLVECPDWLWSVIWAIQVDQWNSSTLPK